MGVAAGFDDGRLVSVVIVFLDVVGVKGGFEVGVKIKRERKDGKEENWLECHKRRSNQAPSGIDMLSSTG